MLYQSNISLRKGAKDNVELNRKYRSSIKKTPLLIYVILILKDLKR